MEQNLNETINISKSEYNHMKEVYDNYCKLYNNDFFIKIKKGLILPKDHQNYYNGRIDIEIYDENTYSIQIEGKNYSINNDTFNELKKVIEKNIEKLIFYSKMETKQFLLENSYEGGMPTSIFVKYGQLMVNLNGQVFGEIENFCSEFRDNVISLIINNNNLIINDISTKENIKESNYNDKFVWNDGMVMITDEGLKTIIDEVIRDNEEISGNNDHNWNVTVYDIMKKIIDLSSGTTTTIANLTNYNPNEKFVEPLVQGRISFLVKETCKKLNIELEHNNDKIGGLAYYREFVKLNNDKFVWKEGEIKIAKTQCELCKYNNESTPNECEKYPNGKLQEVISNTNKCNYLTTQNDIL